MKINITEKESELIMSLLNEQRNYDCYKIYLKISEKYDRLQVAKINSPKQTENMTHTGNNTCNHCGKIVDYLNYKHHLYMYCINKTPTQLSGLSDYELKLEQIVDAIKNEPSTLECINTLKHILNGKLD